MSTASEDAQLKSPSYPSNCLHFLRNADKKSTKSTNEGNDSTVQLDIAIVGAGIAGLATAIALARKKHTVTIYEQAERLAEVGAGIQIPPNSTRLLLNLGLGPYLEKYVTEPGSVLMRRWQNGKVIGKTRLYPEFREQFDAPYWVIHRAHLHEAMHRLAVDLGVTVKLVSRVISYDVEVPSLTLESGSTVLADFVVAADGLKSSARKVILGDDDYFPKRTGFVAYRTVVDVEHVKNDPQVSWLLEKPSFNLWLGDNKHVMTYIIGAGKSFNMVFNCADPSDPAEWSQDMYTLLDSIRREFRGWDPVLMRLTQMIDKTMKWPLYSGSTMPRWVAGKLVILGDAAHSMIPYMSQGAAIAVEDGVALANSIDKISCKDSIPLALSIFENVRIKRASRMQEASLLNSKLWHFPDGPTQQERDKAMEAEVEGRPFSHSPNQWSDPATQMWCFGYDTDAEIDRAWIN